MANTTELVRGQAGGLATLARYGRKHMRKIGLKGASKGGQAVVAKYGHEYMSLLGTLGSNVVNEHLSRTGKTRIERNIRRIIKEVNN